MDYAKIATLKDKAVDVVEGFINDESPSMTEEQFHAANIRLNAAFNIIAIPTHPFGEAGGLATMLDNLPTGPPSEAPEPAEATT